MALIEYVEQAWLRTSVQAELSAGETILAMADFSMPVPNQSVGRLFVLTNKHLRCMAFKQTLASAFGKNKPRPLVYSHAVAFHQITSLGTAHQTGMLRPEMYSMVFTGPTGAETWWTRYRQGHELIEMLKKAVFGTAPRPVGLADDLQKLAALTAEGVLTSDEFDRAKALFLGAPADRQNEAITLLRQLHGLHTSGVLTQGEFNAKKWDVLARSEGR